MQNFLFYLTGAIMIFCAIRAVTSPFIFRAALYLAATLALTAVQYVLMQAEFVAVVQLMVYVGAVIILIIFAVMLTAQLGEGNISQSNKLALPAFLVSGAFGFGLWKILSDYDWTKAVSIIPAPAPLTVAAAVTGTASAVTAAVSSTATVAATGITSTASAVAAATSVPLPSIVYNNVQSIGAALVSDYIYPFEIIGLLLFTALIGAVLIARKDGSQ
jgi:NADH:ubiquinone oxidoreductase subunit 6 (subunit J)